MDDNASVYSIQSTLSTRHLNSKKREASRVFRDVKRKLAKICSESEEMTRNMEGMFRSLSRNPEHPRRRSSLQANTSFQLDKNESFFKTLKVPEITEVTEEEEDDTRSVFSIQVKDEVGHCQSKLQEYLDLVQEMTAEVERVEQENQLLFADVEALALQLEEGEEHRAKLQGECNGWTKKFLNVLQELEDSRRDSQVLEERLHETQKECEALKKKAGSHIKEEEVLQDLQLLFKENEQLKSELKTIRDKELEATKQKQVLEENVDHVQKSYKLLSSQLMDVMDNRDFLQSQLALLEKDQLSSELRREKLQEDEVGGLRARLVSLESENRQLQGEVKAARTRNLELESEVNFLNQRDNHLGLTSQLESSRMLLDMTQDFGNTSLSPFNKTRLNVTNHLLDESVANSVFSKHQPGTGIDCCCCIHIYKGE